MSTIIVSEGEESPLEDGWISLPERSTVLGEVRQVEGYRDNMSELAELIESGQDVAMEQFHWMFTRLSQQAQIAPSSKVTLEDYTSPRSKRLALLGAVRQQIAYTNQQLDIALEGYAEEFRTDFDELLAKYKRTHSKLETVDANLDFKDPNKSAVNHTRLWSMFHVRNKFEGEDPIKVIKQEAGRLEKLTRAISTAVERITKDLTNLAEGEKLDRTARDLTQQDRTYLMFNRSVKIVDGETEYDEVKPKGPTKSFSGWQWFKYILIAAFFSRHGAALYEAYAKPEKNQAKVDTKHTHAHELIHIVLSLQDIAADLATEVDKLQKLYTKASDDTVFNLNRRVSPVMDLAIYLLKQVTEITHGTDTLFSKVVRKSTK